MKRMDNPYGMNDRLIEESRIIADLEARVSKSLALRGFDRISTPLIEYYEVFAKREAAFDEDSIYKFIDRDGSIMALRPDMTIPCARVASTKLKSYPKPLKLLYSGNIYRVDGSNKRRELSQIGAEIFGERGIWADIEILIACCDCIKELGINDFKIDIGHGGFFEGISKKAGLSQKDDQKLRQLLNEKNIVELQAVLRALNIDGNCSNIILKLPNLFGNSKAVLKELEKYDLHPEAQAAVDYADLFFSKLEASPYRDNISLDMSMTSDMKYYTGIIFRGYASGAAGVILSGGRYDSLSDIFQSDFPAVGFALYMDQILSVIAEQNSVEPSKEKSLIVFDDKNYDRAIEFADNLRNLQRTASLIHINSFSQKENYMKTYGYSNLYEFIEGEGEGKC